MTSARPNGLRSLPKDSWIGLEEALSWICFDEAFDLETLSGALPDMGISEEEAKDEYQAAWRELAEFSSRSGLVVRGYRRARETESQSRELSRDDLFNCQFLDFILTPRGRAILVSRFDREKEGIWRTITDPNGSDFVHILIHREDLLSFKKRARPRLVSRRASAPKSRAALEYARRQIEGKQPSEVRREEIISNMREQFGISRKTARSHWMTITEGRPDLRCGGRRKRAG